MPDPIVTREFCIDDYDTAVELWKKAEGVEIAEGDSRDEIARYLERNPALSRVALIDSEIIAVVLCGHDGRRGFIYHLAVEPNYQGRGIGKRLLGECLAGLRRAGITRVLIMVARDNPRGREFWRRNGWEELTAIAMAINP
jgi:ribosomal protein S18 acetylase RimI-like enzyme